MKSAVSPHVPTSRRHALWLLLAYPVFAIAGVVTHRPIFALLALAVLASVLMLPRLQSRRPLPWLLWLLMLAGVWLASRLGLADLLLEAVPILINVALA